MSQELNLNVFPYYDDFDENKDYYNVLFKPSVPVQARELNVSQSILQKQIERFGSHVFKEGARVSGGEISYKNDLSAIILENSYNGINLDSVLSVLKGTILTGKTSGIKAKVAETLSSKKSEIGSLTLYVDYVSSSSDGISQNFLPGEVLQIETAGEFFKLNTAGLTEGQDFGITKNENHLAFAHGVYINSGVYYIKGKFLRVNGKFLLLDQYNNVGSHKVGFKIYEEFVDYIDDESLLDNSNGFTNYAAPGSDRLKITAELINIPLFAEESNFILLKQITDGVEVTSPYNTQYDDLANEFARRTYDESGDYYVKAPTLSIKESLNNLKGNGGIFSENSFTYYKNKPSEDLGCYVISPFKSYIRGFELGTPNTTYIDFKKPRTTKRLENQNVIYNTGSTFTLNRVHGSPIIGIGNTYYVSLRDNRVEDNQNNASGKEIGLARVYDFALESGSYSNNLNLNEWDISLYDIQTYVEITLNQPITLATPTHIKGKSSGATAFLRYDASSSGIITAYNVSGKFSIGESFVFDGIENTRISTAVTSYGISDIKSIYGKVGTAYTFNSDVKQSIIDVVGTVAITSTSSGISTVSNPSIFFQNIIKPGNLVSYTLSGNSDINYSKVISVSQNSFTISGVTTVPGICEGSLPQSDVTVSDLKIISSTLNRSSESKLYTQLPKQYISDVDLTNSFLTIKRQFNCVISSNSTEVTITESDQNFLPYDEERYTLIRENGTTEILSEDKIIIDPNGKKITINGLTSGTGNAKLIATLRKETVSSKIKNRNRVKEIIIDKSRKEGSGIGQTTLNNGITFGNYAYGTRVEDQEICLLEPDVTKLYAVIESSDTNNPDSPSMTFGVLDGASGSTNDLVLGEEFIGESSNALGIYTKKVNSLKIEFIGLNNVSFVDGENVRFRESNVTGRIASINFGDNDITSSFTLDTNQKDTIYDYSKITRSSNKLEPTKKLKIIFESAGFSSSDTGDIITVNSYSNFDYCDIKSINGISNSDIIDLRPRVSDYGVAENSRSPFEFLGRTFNQAGNSVTNILASDESFPVHYSFYLPRIDRIFFTKFGNFQVNYGNPSENPVPPSGLDDSLEIASVYLPPYLCYAGDARPTLMEYKRYKMSDIRLLEKRIENLEYYTSLSLLESKTASLQIKDSNGIDRFKSGFFVDDFSSNINQQKITITKNSIDINNAELRPTHYTTSIDLLRGTNSILGIGTQVDSNYDLSSDNTFIGNGVKITGRVVTLDYEEVNEISQPYATKIVNVVPYGSRYYGGNMKLQPSSDVWIDQISLEPKTIQAEGNYVKTLLQEDVDPQTGFGNPVWNSWEINWTGETKTTKTTKETEKYTNSPKTGSVTKDGQKIYEVTTTTTIKTGTQTREGTQTLVKESFANESLGNSLVSSDVLPYVRSRNVQFTAKSLKPFTRMYPFFDGVDVSSYVFPKLVEIEMLEGVFEVGEDVSVLRMYSPPPGMVLCAIPAILARIRIAKQNHKYGDYRNPSDIFRKNPYDQTSLTDTYTSSSSILNIDTFSLSEMVNGEYFGNLVKDVILHGLSSGARARVRDIRIITDDVGTVIGSFFIPGPNTSYNSKFEAGEKVFRLTNSDFNSKVEGVLTTSVETTYYAQGSINTVKENIISLRNATIDTTELSETQNITDTKVDVNKKLVKTIDPTVLDPTIIPRTGDPCTDRVNADPNYKNVTAQEVELIAPINSSRKNDGGGNAGSFADNRNYHLGRVYVNIRGGYLYGSPISVSGSTRTSQQIADDINSQLSRARSRLINDCKNPKKSSSSSGTAYLTGEYIEEYFNGDADAALKAAQQAAGPGGTIIAGPGAVEKYGLDPSKVDEVKSNPATNKQTSLTNNPF